MTHTFDFAFLSLPIAAMGFLIYLACTRYGDIKLSADQAAPAEFSKSSWIMMVFLAGIATGLMLWAGTEWAYHYAWTPFGLEPKTTEMYVVGLTSITSVKSTSTTSVSRAAARSEASLMVP